MQWTASFWYQSNIQPSLVCDCLDLSLLKMFGHTGFDNCNPVLAKHGVSNPPSVIAPPFSATALYRHLLQNNFIHTPRHIRTRYTQNRVANNSQLSEAGQGPIHDEEHWKGNSFTNEFGALLRARILSNTGARWQMSVTALYLKMEDNGTKASTAGGANTLKLEPNHQNSLPQYEVINIECTGWFFNSLPPPKKLKYVKPRLGVSTLT